MNLRERYRPIALASNLLVVSSFAVFIVLLMTNHGLSLVNVAIGSAILLIGNLVFVGSGIITPGLVAPGKIVFPLNLTLPIVFSAWCLVVAFLTWRIGSPLEPAIEPFRKFANLFDWMDLIWLPIVQCSTLTVAAVANMRNVSAQLQELE
ncbi:MAG TPA: hypothetical protein VJ835_07790 [Fimbriimonadaceae bacterium]|nr:hypothetical protein [Fimbriimonadaceae bacterium]